MADASWKSSRYHRTLDTLSSRVGICATIGFLVILCFAAGLFTHSVIKQLEGMQAVFEDRQIGNGYVAISDVQRLILVAQRATNAGEVSPELDEKFRDAADIIYVRTNHLKTILKGDEGFVSGKASIESLEKIIDIADRIIAEDYADLTPRVDELLIAAEKARGNLLRYLETMRRLSDKVITTQTLVVKKQQIIMAGALAGLTLVGIIALIFLRLEVLGRHARDNAEKRVEFLAFYDGLTKLPNRVQFQDRLHQLLEVEKCRAALLLIDLDEFKAINDTYGHAAGDAVLQRVGTILQEAANSHNGFAARLGGDEFALVVPTDDMKVLTVLCEHLIARASTSFDLDGESLQCRASIGLATSTQVSETMSPSVDIMSRVTDFALYASKAEGRNCYTVYDLALEKRFLERRAMLEELPGAIEREDLEMYLQPKVELPHGRIYGFEALVRWNRNGQLVNPGEFILLAEESGLVVDIDNFVLNRASRLIAQHNERHGTAFSVSVNLSALHFSSNKIVKMVEYALWRSDIRPDLLTLEITETTEMRDWKQANEIIDGLRGIGCKISIDDFGTGFSSLAYLRAMIADELKVDRSLVEEIEVSKKARLMLASVFEIARNMEMEVVVEGIENETQASVIHKMGATRAQGFLFGRPACAQKALESTLTEKRVQEQKVAGE